ncbi:TniQ family protein [Paludibacterium denitrificans]|uniref:TniQ domain-containing protein n=1 Tax=Paludibacterium denitrificans TaxID=2675226 RepID=A0A844GCI8_9NEIS|nr:hypothetical protein [Paludibacterium denitrificans]
MTPFARYPVRPVVQPGESLAGYLYRFYNDNHHKVPAPALAAAMQMYQGSEAKQATANSILSVLFGKVAHRMHATGRHINYCQAQRVTFSHHPHPKPEAATQFCPACIEERQIHKALWELPFVEACPVHETALLESCPTCDRPYTWSSLNHDWACRCEIPISEHTCPRASRKQVQLARFMARVDSAWSTGERQSDRRFLAGQFTRCPRLAG